LYNPLATQRFEDKVRIDVRGLDRRGERKAVGQLTKEVDNQVSRIWEEEEEEDGRG